MAWSDPRPRTNSRPGPQPIRERSGSSQGSHGTLPSHPPRVPLPTFALLLPRLLPLLLLLLLGSPHPGLAGPPPRPARPPLLSGQPFIIFWGVPDAACPGRPELAPLGVEPEGRVAVFYEESLGSYPYFLDRDTPVNGGLPQHTRLNSHLQKAGEDLAAALPAPRYLGLGVLRWAEWTPQWGRDREKQALYLEASRALLKSFFPDWTPVEVEKWAQVDFEAAGQSILTETLREVRRLRPKALWGVSPYPTCYTLEPSQTPPANSTGGCPAQETELNNQLQWLWKRSSALYPFLSLEKLQGGTSGARLLLSNQIREALRVASMSGTTYDLPVFPLVKSTYTSTNTFLSQADLLYTIGESAALGAAGVVIWEREDAKTERECGDLAEFTRQVLGPYSVNVTTATRLCSSALCQGRGRCIRQNPDSSAYLHMPTTAEKVGERADKEEEKEGEDEEKPDVAPATEEPDTTTVPPDEPDPAVMWKKDFLCQWFETSEEAISDQESPKDGAAIVGQGVQNTGDAEGPVGTSTVKDSSLGDTGDSGTSGAGSPKPSSEVATDHGTKPGYQITALLLVLVAEELLLVH
ncbi:glyco_hydro_56 domain-containing protein [Gadus macrocephalus]|uniref:glyco_hydro_56 domain-containing protein n=1 Tax=Gadus macrocephalus TaxID=80720 RepID=UPI0028CB751D|nr:glyco_hydro_56 domain-containing protein [Gadus macrocephalus]XP_059908348.1 glyco_hydro_56 domain-containing protein [Gadus macrocephalus]